MTELIGLLSTYEILVLSKMANGLDTVATAVSLGMTTLRAQKIEADIFSKLKISELRGCSAAHVRHIDVYGVRPGAWFRRAFCEAKCGA